MGKRRYTKIKEYESVIPEFLPRNGSILQKARKDFILNVVGVVAPDILANYQKPWRRIYWQRTSG